jgi:hypothetical protein
VLVGKRSVGACTSCWLLEKRLVKLLKKRIDGRVDNRLVKWPKTSTMRRFLSFEPSQHESRSYASATQGSAGTGGNGNRGTAYLNTTESSRNSSVVGGLLGRGIGLGIGFVHLSQKVSISIGIGKNAVPSWDGVLYRAARDFSR